MRSIMREISSAVSINSVNLRWRRDLSVSSVRIKDRRSSFKRM